MTKILVKFHWDYGRMGNVNGLFITTKEKLEDVYGRDVYFGEILGKHSEVYGELNEEDFTIVSEEQDKIEWLQNLMGSETISEYNPFDYLDDEEDEDLYGEEE